MNSKQLHNNIFIYSMNDFSSRQKKTTHTILIYKYNDNNQNKVYPFLPYFQLIGKWRHSTLLDHLKIRTPYYCGYTSLGSCWFKKIYILFHKCIQAYLRIEHTPRTIIIIIKSFDFNFVFNKKKLYYATFGYFNRFDS